MPRTPRGPFLQVATFFENLIEGKDNVLTVVRMVQRVDLTATAESPPADIATLGVPIPLHLLVVLRAGNVRANGVITVDIERPDGKIRVHAESAIQWPAEEDDMAVNAIFNMGLAFTITGIHWFIIRYDGRLLTRLPLNVAYQPVSVASDSLH